MSGFRSSGVVSSRRSGTAARRWVLAALVCILVAGVALVAVRTINADPHVRAQTVALPGGVETTAQVDEQWTVTVPVGGVPAGGAQLMIVPAPPSGDPADGDSERPLIGAGFVLSTGQPAAPWTFTYRPVRPLPADRTVYLVDEMGSSPDEVTPATVRPARWNADRSVAEVTVEHLSLKQWWEGATSGLTAFIGKFFGQRTDPPRCDDAGAENAQRPAWLKEAIHVEDRNAPLLVCTGRDPRNPDIAVVKLANNRGGAFVVTAPTRPEWAYHKRTFAPVTELPIKLVNRALVALNVPRDRLDRAWILLPGEEVHIGLTRDQVLRGGAPAKVAATFDPTSMAFGMFAKEVLKQLDGAGANGWDTAFLLACVDKASANDDVAVVLLGLARCAIEHPEEIAKMMTDNGIPVPAGLSRVVAAAKRVATRILIVGQGAFVITDLITTFGLIPDALQVALFAQPATPAAPTRAALWRRWQQLNDTCRGTVNATAACTERDAVQEQHARLSAKEFLAAWRSKDATAMRRFAHSDNAAATDRRIPEDLLLSFTPTEAAFDCRYDRTAAEPFGCYISVAELGTSLYFSWDMDLQQGWLVRSYVPDV